MKLGLISLFISALVLCCFSCSHGHKLRLPSSKNETVGVLGDLEGDWKRFDSYVTNSDVLYRDESGAVALRQGKSFVFLGDLSDRGPGTLRLMKILLDLKKKHPERITLILGNREINKMKIFSLMNQYRNSPVPELIFPYYKTHLKEKYGLSFPEDISLEAFQKLAAPYDNEVTRLQVFLIGMNAKDAFEYRRKELSLLEKRSFSDEEVYFSFKRDMTKGSVMYEYLKEGELIKTIDGNLFTHGAITDENFGLVPGETKNFEDLGEWQRKLNDFLQDEIDQWFEDPTKGQDLLDYHAPRYGKKTNPYSVIYARFSDETGNPSPPSRSLVGRLKDNGIYRIIVGHTPTGDHPIIVKESGLEIILADNSYSDLTSSRVLLRGKKSHIISYMQDGTKVMARTNAYNMRNPIGLRTVSGWRVLGLKEDDGHYYLMKINGRGKTFKTDYKVLSPKELSKPGILAVNTGAKMESCSQIMNWIIKNRLPLSP